MQNHLRKVEPLARKMSLMIFYKTLLVAMFFFYYLIYIFWIKFLWFNKIQGWSWTLQFLLPTSPLLILFSVLTKYVSCFTRFPILFFRFVNNHIDGQPYDIEFTFNRFPLRRQHFAVEEAFKYHMEPVLFPKSTDQGSKMPLCTVKEDTR